MLLIVLSEVLPRSGFAMQNRYWPPPQGPKYVLSMNKLTQYNSEHPRFRAAVDLLRRLIAVPSPSGKEDDTATIWQRWLEENGVGEVCRVHNNVFVVAPGLTPVSRSLCSILTTTQCVRLQPIRETHIVRILPTAVFMDLEAMMPGIGRGARGDFS